MNKDQYEHQKEQIAVDPRYSEALRQWALEQLEETYEKEGLIWLSFVDPDDIPPELADKKKLSRCLQCNTSLYISFQPHELEGWRIVQDLGEVVKGVRSVPNLPTLEKIDGNITILLYGISYNEVSHICDL